MFTTLDTFLQTWSYESASTQKLMDALTDASLSQPVHEGGRTLGRLAWHVAQTLPEMMGKTGLHVAGLGEHDPAPASASAIAQAYREASASLMEQLQAHWTDATLLEQDDMYGDQWTRGVTLSILVNHQSHHRGQMTVLMRQAGLPVAGMYGPSKDEWAQMGMDPPPV
ncbi:DinB family protein [Gemmatimonas sp.]|jgi:uncharacterized damage-inducible protein DinB|uniref:DinB family protein n=1 Tax=Gemmatimonas sp. TaxID=1962908 RepID=UPI0037C04E31